MPAAVTLNVYDLDDGVTRTLNKALKPVASGAYHAAVELYGREWSFGAGEQGTGVFSCEPRGCTGHCFREALPMGETQLSEEEFLGLLEDIGTQWPATGYDLLRRNCCHFSAALCELLGVGPAPVWLTSLCGAGSALDDMAHARPVSATVEQGKLARGASTGDAYQFGDFTRGLAAVTAAAVGGAVNGVVAEGKAARGASNSDEGQLDDVPRGLLSVVQKQASSVLATGKEARGASTSDSYAFGDVTRGLVGRLGR